MGTEDEIKTLSHTKCPLCNNGELEFIGISLDEVRFIYRNYQCNKCGRKIKIRMKMKPINRKIIMIQNRFKID